MGHLALEEMSVSDVECAYRRIRSGEFSPVGISTLHRIHATLMSALNSAVRRGLIPTNPAALVELPRPPRREMAVWTTQQARTFLEGSQDHPWHLLYRLLLICGVRRGEVIGLRYTDITADGDALLILRQVTRLSGTSLVGEPKSLRGVRTVHLDTQTLALLQHHRSQDPNPDGFVFHTPDGEPLDPATVSRQFLILTRDLGLPRIRLHDLRHTSASLGLEAGEPITQVSRRLGHSTIAITADTYTHVSTEAAQQAADTLAARIGSHLRHP